MGKCRGLRGCWQFQLTRRNADGSSETNENPADSVLIIRLGRQAAANVENYAYIREEAEEEAAEAGVLPQGSRREGAGERRGLDEGGGRSENDGLHKK